MRTFRIALWIVAGTVLVTTSLSCPKESPQALLIMDATAMTSQTQCMIRPGATAQMLRPYGVLDLAITNYYWLYPRIRNMMPTLQETSGEGPTGLYPKETNYINIHTARVHVNTGAFYSTYNATEGPTADAYLYDGFTFDVVATVKPEEEGVVAIQVVPPDLGSLLAKKIQSRSDAKNPGIWISAIVQVEGRTQDLWTVHSNEFRFPILTCYGCLIRCVTNDPTEPPVPGNIPCNPGQDDGVDNNFCPFVALDPSICRTACPF